MMTDPEPYNSNESMFASVIEDNTIRNTTQGIRATLRFISPVPLPPIETKQVLLFPNNLNTWKSEIPESITTTDRVHLTFHYEDKDDITMSDWMNRGTAIQTLFESNQPPTSISIEIPYYITIESSTSDSSHLTLSKSMGEGEPLTNYLLNIPNRRIQQQSQSQVSSMIQSILNVGLEQFIPTYTQELELLHTMGFLDE